MRIISALWCTAEIHQSHHPMTRQQLCKLINRMVVMTDCVEIHDQVYKPTNATAAWKAK
jgi:hypothetical protein